MPLGSPITFDGINKLIIINAGQPIIDVRLDIYSSWIRWLVLDDNSKFLPAMRYIGGDPIGGGQLSGAMFFLLNGWQIVVNASITVEGIIYHEDGIDVFIISPGGGVINKVASLAYAYSAPIIPTPTEIRSEIDNNSAKLVLLVTKLEETLTKINNIPQDTWNVSINTLTNKTTIGGYVSKVLLSIPKFLGLK